jgi:hypothetical protein
MGPGRRSIVAALAVAAILGGCAPGLSAEAEAWCRSHQDAVFRTATELKQSGTTSGWDKTKDADRQACQKAFDARAAAGPSGSGG